MAANNDKNTALPIEMDRVERIKRTLADALAYIIPLVMSTPGLYAGLMTMPLLAYLELTLFSQGGISYLLLGGSTIENAVLILGLVFFLYSVLCLWRTKPKRLVTGGPYRIVRHPQYLGLILFTAVLTSRSVWVLLNTFGIGYLPPYETLNAWFLMVIVYVGLAMFEERHLMHAHQEEWQGYRKRVGFLIPFVRSRRRWLEIPVSFLFLVALMLSLLFSNNALWWLV